MPYDYHILIRNRSFVPEKVPEKPHPARQLAGADLRLRRDTRALGRDLSLAALGGCVFSAGKNEFSQRSKTVLGRDNFLVGRKNVLFGKTLRFQPFETNVCELLEECSIEIFKMRSEYK